MVLRGRMIASMKARLDNGEYFLKTHFFGKSLTVINKRKQLFQRIKAGGKGGKPGQWSARKAQMLAKQYKAKGGGYK